MDSNNWGLGIRILAEAFATAEDVAIVAVDCLVVVVAFAVAAVDIREAAVVDFPKAAAAFADLDKADNPVAAKILAVENIQADNIVAHNHNPVQVVALGIAGFGIEAPEIVGPETGVVKTAEA